MEREIKQFINIRPGGNDTTLIEGVITDPIKRRELNGFIEQTYSNIEQVGFVNLEPDNVELMMAGGEFCGNATRSTAWLALQGKPGEIFIKVSGVEKPLRAGVTQDGEAFAQMPIYSDLSRITEDPTAKGNYIVEMEGITHYIAFDENMNGLSSDEIKQKGMQKLKEIGLDKAICSGVIYTEKYADAYAITPVVYVRDIDTLFAETACGSGTTALGLVLALQKNTSIRDVPILQPSGFPIKVSVDFTGESFTYAEIKGPIEELVTGQVVEMENKEKYVIEQVATEEQLDSIGIELLAKLYQDIFSQPPYYESFTEKEVQNIFQEYIQNGILFLARTDTEVIGFGAAVPLPDDKEVSTIIGSTGIDIENCWYMADLGVKETYRGNDIGKKLVQARMDALPSQTRVIMRTSINNLVSQGIYRSFGFEALEGVNQEVEQRRIDETVQKDRRLFLMKTL